MPVFWENDVCSLLNWITTILLFNMAIQTHYEMNKKDIKQSFTSGFIIKI